MKPKNLARRILAGEHPMVCAGFVAEPKKHGYVVRFSAVLHVPVEAVDEDSAAAKATVIAHKEEEQYDWMADHTPGYEPIVQIHPDDIVGIEKDNKEGD